MISLFIGIFFHFIFSWFFVLYLKMGITGTGIAGILMNLVVFVIQFTYANFFVQDLKETLEWPDSRIFSLEGIKSYMKIGLPSIITFVLDSWVFEALLLLSGYFGVEA